MARPQDLLQTVDLKAVDFQGLIREDVMDQIFDISPTDIPFIASIGSDTAKNTYVEWTTDRLGDPTAGGWVVEGSDIDQNDAATGKRLGNHIGILVKGVQVSSSADQVTSVGGAGGLAYQLMQRQKELRNKEEANLLGIQGNEPDDGSTNAGQPAGFAAMATQFDTGSGATGGGFASGVWTPITPGAKTPLTETMIRDAAQAAWEDGGNPSKLMSVPGVIRKLSEYMFTSSSRIATLTAETNQNGPATAMGSVNVFLTDFGVTLDMVPNRRQLTYGTGGANAAVFIYDPSYVRVSRLQGYRTQALAKMGLSERRFISVKSTLKCLNPDAHRVLLDIDPAAAVTQA